MRRFLVPAALGLLALATPALPQWLPDARRAHEMHHYARPDQAEQLVRGWYLKYLNRDVDPTGYQSWVNGLRSGTSPEMTLAGILSSDEYYMKGGSTPEGYVQTLFRDLAGRAPTPREMDYWVRRVCTEPRNDVAYAMVTRYPQIAGTIPQPWERHEQYEYRRPVWRYR